MKKKMQKRRTLPIIGMERIIVPMRVRIRKHGECSKRSQDANDAKRRDVRSHARNERHEAHHYHHEVHHVPSVLQVRFALEEHPGGDHLDEHLNREDDGEEELAIVDG